MLIYLRIREIIRRWFDGFRRPLLLNILQIWNYWKNEGNISIIINTNINFEWKKYRFKDRSWWAIVKKLRTSKWLARFK